MSEAVTLESFFNRLAGANPFLENRVNGPAPSGLDVPEIHRGSFEKLTSLAEQALTAQRGLGAVLWGEAGIGKSHLLARLDRWAEQTRATFLYLHNLQAAPDALPRSLLHAVVNLLTGGRRRHFPTTRLYRLVLASLVASAGGEGRYDSDVLERAYHRWLDGLGPAAGDRLVYQVFFSFFHSAQFAALGRDDGRAASLAVRWLSGGALDPDEAHFLGLPPARHRDDPVSLEDAQQIKQVLVAFSRLALCQGRPFVLAIDQVDNLDQEQFASLARFLEALLDTAPNLLVITSGIQATLVDWRQRGVVQLSAWDRIAQTEVRLHRLTPALAERLLRTRLDAFLAPFSSLDKIAAQRREDPFFPIGRRWAHATLLNQIEVRPRDVISLARDGWHAQQARLHRLGGEDWLLDWASGKPVEPEPPLVWTPELRRAAIDQEIERALLAVRDELHAAPGTLGTDADRLAGVLHDILQHFRAPASDLVAVERIPPPRRGAAPAYHLSLRRKADSQETNTGVLVMATGAAVSVAAFLNRLRQNAQPLDRLVLVTEERIGMPLGDKGEEHLEALRQRGPGSFLPVELTFGEHADLEALSAILGRAKAGDLEIEPPGQPPEKISVEEVITSPTWRDRALEHRLLNELVSTKPRPPLEQTSSLAASS
jgi:hypothetical protein